ncbi:hypothetical protein H6763_00400 [Candidatus Nomurabacteria bacterium]|uniref:Cohesin domain-containing protein n=1 Tax=Candidatus Dojkabacteria bacterium TaxID=2099670 RepID=A0A955I2D4_9BACT|nr:hypothetical protein [Candidatus Dojkabacteria bacterium]MCB9790205.1 hypothetical protein [Candidatus Nomurabacteria bacterium]MCB9803275.1 hypothetical protein [Candidatus Nomurabacteria bacterium]
MKRSYRQILFYIIAVAFMLAFPKSSFAAPTFKFNPTGGYVMEGDEFTLDILIDSDGEELIKAKSVITFDPTLVEIIKAERNNALFDQFPADEQSTDNTNGVLMLSGFTQSGAGDLYKTGANPDVFARITFKTLWDGVVTFDWEYTGTDAPFKSVMISDGSPPQNILTSKPVSATFTIQDSTGNSGTGNYVTPITGIFESDMFLPGFLVLLGGLMVFTGTNVVYRVSRRLILMRRRTLVEYDHDE